MPLKICERITPELPRAPMSEPWLRHFANVFMSRPLPPPAGMPGEPAPDAVEEASSTSAWTASSVRAMLVPVSPSGTG